MAHGLCSSAQKVADIIATHARHANDFVPAALASGNGNGRSRYLQKFREKVDARLIRAAFDRRRGQRKFQSVPEFARDRVLFRARMNSDTENNSVQSCFDGDQVFSGSK